MAASNAPIWQPTADQATPPRVSLSTRLTSLNELPCSSLFSAGTRQPSNTMSAFCTVRSAYLPSIFVGVKPGVPFSTTKVFTWSSATSRAETAATAAAWPASRARGGRAGGGDCAVADPALGAVDDPAVAVAAGRGLQTAGDVGAAVGPGGGEGAARVQRPPGGWRGRWPGRRRRGGPWSPDRGRRRSRRGAR